MRVKHLDDLYTWEQIKKLRLVHRFNPDNGFVPVALYAPGEGRTTHYGGGDQPDSYEWEGTQSSYCAKILWEKVRLELAGRELDSLACDIVEASECFNTIRFKNPGKAQAYRDEFVKLLREFADGGKLKSAIGRVPARPYPWDYSKRYQEQIVPGDIEYAEFEFPGWSAVEKYFIELTEAELAFLAGEQTINRQPTEKDKELAEACRNFDVQEVSRLLDSGANANAFTGGVCPFTLLDLMFMSAFDHKDNDAKLRLAFQIAELLISHGCDIDLSPFDGSNILRESLHYDVSITKFLLERGAGVNAISWIGFDDEPVTPLDHVSDDISVYGEEPYLLETFKLLHDRGAQYFSELVPDFYKT